MSWEWSHTQEAYENVRKNIYYKVEREREEMEEVWGEWYAYFLEEYMDVPFLDSIKAGMKIAEGLSDYDLAERIWVLSDNQATCENGGFEAWICPYGCGCHMVPFDLIEEEDEEDAV